MGNRISLVTYLINHLLLASLLTACGGGGSSEGTGPNPGDGRTYILDTSSLSPDGCLNMGKLTKAISQFPDQTVVREYTKNISLADAQNVRDRFRPNLFAKAFYILDGSAAESALLRELGTMEQTGCSAVVRKDENSSAEEKFEVIEYSATSISFKTTKEELPEGASNSDRKKHEQKYREEYVQYSVTLTGPQSLKVIKNASMIDFCPVNNDDYSFVRVITDRDVRWGDASVTHSPTESVSIQMLRQVIEGLASAPPGLAQLATEGGLEAPVSVSDLKQAEASNLREDVLACKHYPAPPPAEEGESPGTEIPSGPGAPATPGTTEEGEPAPENPPAIDPAAPAPASPAPEAAPTPAPSNEGAPPAPSAG